MKIKLERICLSLFTAVVVTLTGRAATVLDQSFEPTPVTASAGVDPDKAQTFTATVAGTLAQVDVLVTRNAGTPAPEDLIVEVRSVTGGVPAPTTTAPLASITVPATSVPATLGWLSVDLCPFTIAVTPGTALAIVLRVVGTTPDTDHGWGGAGGNGYPSGASFYRPSGISTWTILDPDIDFGFRIWVADAPPCGPPEPEPEPGPATNKVSKWSQLPGYLVFTNMPDMHGGNRPSDFDWDFLMRPPGPGTNRPIVSAIFDPALVTTNFASVSIAPDFAQVFVPDAPGYFEHCDLPLCRTRTNASDLLVQLVATAAGLPATPLAAAVISATNVADAAQWQLGPQWVGIDLRPFNVLVNPGQRYALVVRTMQAGAAGHYTWLALPGNPYPQGAAFTRANPAAPWLPVPNDLDLGFCIIQLTDVPTPHVVPPNWVIADDFRSDGRPILCVRWWGSYFKPHVTNRVEDGFVLSFFADIPATSNSFSRPGPLLATYVAPFEAVRATNTHWRGWDGHEIWRYEVDLSDTCLAHSNTPIATARGFLERSNVIYWLAINAELGHRIYPLTNHFGQITNWLEFATGHCACDYKHFWGWHTSPTNWNDASVMGHLFMPGQDWVYGQWMPNFPFHMELDQAFELLTTNAAPSPPVMGQPLLAGANLVLNFSTVGGAYYFVEATDTLMPVGGRIPWQPVSGAIAGTGGAAHFIHDGVAHGPLQFYRVVARSASQAPLVCGETIPIFFNASDKDQDVTVEATDHCHTTDSEVYVLDADRERIPGRAVNVPDGGSSPRTTFTVPPGGKVYFACRGREQEGNCFYTLTGP